MREIGCPDLPELAGRRLRADGIDQIGRGKRIGHRLRHRPRLGAVRVARKHDDMASQRA